jgi:Fe-S-cluster containining protein
MLINRDIERAYRALLGDIDAWFKRCLDAGRTAFACCGGCSACCRGLFDISLLDAVLLKRAFSALPAATRAAVLNACHARLLQLQQRWPQLHPPYLLNDLPAHEWQEMPEGDETPCPLLDDNGRCLVYHARPMICRLHGLPNIDCSGQDFEGVVCTLHPGSPCELPDELLHWRFREVFIEEGALMRRFSERLTGKAFAELDTFIPLALLADYERGGWRDLTFKSHPK